MPSTRRSRRTRATDRPTAGSRPNTSNRRAGRQHPPGAHHVRQDLGPIQVHDQEAEQHQAHREKKPVDEAPRPG